MLNYYKKEFAKWLETGQIHPLQKIVIKKSIESLGCEEYDDLSSSDKDDGSNIPILHK